MRSDRRSAALPLVAVFAGGAVGTGLRLAIDTWMPHPPFPVATLLINVAGSFALGLLVARVWPGASLWLRAALGPGLLGSFTTYSAFAVSLVAMGSASSWLLAAGYVAATLALGLGAMWAGLRLGGVSPSASRVRR